MIVTVSGLIGAGKSTVARALAERLGFRYLSVGDVFREMAARRGLTVTEFNVFAEGKPELDHEVDHMQSEMATAGDTVVDSRLGGWLVDADFKVWLRAALDVRARRVASRDGVTLEAARAEMERRERSERSRYRDLYQIDMDDLTPYHVVLDTSVWSADAITDALVSLAERAPFPRGARP